MHLMNTPRTPHARATPVLVLVLCVVGATPLAGAAATAEAPSAGAGAAGAAAREQTNLKTVVIPVEGMTCIACLATVKKTLAAIDGVTDVRVSLVERSARVRFDSSRVSPARLVDAIDKLGYRAGVPAEVGS